MTNYHEELARAGVLVDPSARELGAGCTIIRVTSRQKAIVRSMHLPKPVRTGREADIEVRPLYELDDFAPGKSIERFKLLHAGRQI